MNNLRVFEKYFDTVNLDGELFLGRFWICSNSYYVFFADLLKKHNVYAMFSKKYYLTIELTKRKQLKRGLQEFADVVDEFRRGKGLTVEKYEFWLPHCIVKNKEIGTQFIAESYGVSEKLALEYLYQFDKVFNAVYDMKKQEYFGLPLFTVYEEAENYPLRDNTEKYLNGLEIIKVVKERS